MQHDITLRVRYADTDQMGTYYNSRVFEWFECARTEFLRTIGYSYRQLEQEGYRMPLAEAHAEYLGKAQYDDLLRIAARLSMPGRARFRFDVEVTQAESGTAVARGYTIHAVTDPSGKPVRPPRALIELLHRKGTHPKGAPPTKGG